MTPMQRALRHIAQGVDPEEAARRAGVEPRELACASAMRREIDARAWQMLGARQETAARGQARKGRGA